MKRKNCVRSSVSKEAEPIKEDSAEDPQESNSAASLISDEQQSENWLSWLVGNLASTAKNAYTYFANWFYGEQHSQIHNKNLTNISEGELQNLFPDHKRLDKPAQLISNKTLEVKKKIKESNNLENRKEEYTEQLYNLLNQSCPTDLASEQDYKLKIIFLMLELESIYGGAKKAVREFAEAKILNEHQKTNLHNAILFENECMDDYLGQRESSQFDNYLRRQEIDKEQLSQEEINKYKKKWVQEKDEEFLNIVDKINNDNIDKDKLKELYNLWEFNEEKGVEEFKGTLEQVEEWREITENFSLAEEVDLLGEY